MTKDTLQRKGRPMKRNKKYRREMNKKYRREVQLRKLWIAGVLAVGLCSGCSLQDYQVKRAEAWFEKLMPGSSGKEEQGQEEDQSQEEGMEQEQAERLEESEGKEGSKNQKNGYAQDSSIGQGSKSIQENSIGQGNTEQQENEAQSQSLVLDRYGQSAENGQGQKQEISYTTKYVINCKNSITLREHPSTSAAQLDEILLGEPVSFIQDDADGFSKIVYQGKTGYVLAAYLGDTAPTVNDTAYYTMRVVNCRESISLRKTPSVKAAEICQIPLGAIVSYVDSAADGFYEISYLGKNGYALASYLEFYSAPKEEMASADADHSQAVRVSFTSFIQNDRECADIVGFNAQNQKVWQYEARSSHGITELEAIQEIGIVGDTYYLNEDGTIVALALNSGRVLWKNADFGGASLSFAADEQGTLYLCGYYGPDLCAIDRNGNTLIDVQHFSPELQWPYEIRYESGAVYITFSYSGMDEEVVVRYDLATGGISY